MTDVFKRLNTTLTFTSATAATIYTVPGSTSTIVKKIVVSNNGGTSALAKIYHVPTGSSAGVSNIILPATTLGSNEYGVDDAPFAMAAGDFIAVAGDGTNAISISIYGLEIS